MWTIGLMLSAVMGGVLGRAGGSATILAVPILHWAFGLDAHQAIASALVVIATTSACALAAHAAAGTVRWRTGIAFGALTMAGAYAGGRVAAWVSGDVLLLLFGGLVLATALALLRGHRRAAPPGHAAPAGVPMATGVGVGALTGLVGAAGGFLVVPALVRLGRVPAPVAIGTSLLVITMNAVGGFAGHAAHDRPDMYVAGAASAAAVIGALVGVRIRARRAIPARSVHEGFGWLLLALAGGMLVEHLPPGVPRGPIAGGMLIGASATLLMLALGRIAGISGIVGGLLAPVRGDTAWRAAFVGGLLTGGLLLRAAAPASVGASVVPLPLLVVAGLLVGVGTRLGNGCTSGHGVCGLSRGSPRSLAATLVFMAAGAVTVFVVRHVAGGAS